MLLLLQSFRRKRERERKILLYFQLGARWQVDGPRIYLNLESFIHLNPSCYDTFGIFAFQLEYNSDPFG